METKLRTRLRCVAIIVGLAVATLSVVLFPAGQMDSLSALPWFAMALIGLSLVGLYLAAWGVFVGDKTKKGPEVVGVLGALVALQVLPFLRTGHPDWTVIVPAVLFFGLVLPMWRSRKSRNRKAPN